MNREPSKTEQTGSPPKRRPWGPASYWRSGVVVLALVIAVLLFLQLV